MFSYSALPLLAAPHRNTVYDIVYDIVYDMVSDIVYDIVYCDPVQSGMERQGTVWKHFNIGMTVLILEN